MKKRILSLFMCLALILGMLPVYEAGVQAAGTTEDMDIVAGEPLVITAEDLGVVYNPVDYSIQCFWSIKKGDTDYAEDENLIELANDKVTISEEEGNCILDGATVSLSYILSPGVAIPTEASKNVLLHATHTESDWILDEEGSTEEQIKRYKECTGCHYKMAEETIAYSDSVIKAISVSNVDIPETEETSEDTENMPASLTYGGQYQLSSISFEVYSEETDAWETLGEEDAILDNTTYRVIIGLAAATGYTFDEELSNADITINETKGTLEEITGDGKYAFVCKEFRYNCVHSYTEKIEDEEHLVADTGNNCKSVYQYYYDCVYCDAISPTESWESNTFGSHDLDENDYCSTCQATVYDVWVGSTQITSKNAADVFGDETVSYHPETRVLALNGYKNEGNVYKYGDGMFVAIYSKGDLNLELSGSNEITFSEGGEDDETAGIMSEEGGVTISGDKDAELNVEATIPICANEKHVIVYGGTLNLSGTIGIMAESSQINGGATTIEASYANVVLYGLHEGTDGMDSTGETLEVTGGDLCLRAGELGKFVFNSYEGAYMAPDFGGCKGYIIKGYIPPRAVGRMAVKGHWEEYDPEKLGQYCEIKLEKIPEDQAITSVEIGNFQFPTIGQKLDDIVNINTSDTLTYQGNYKMDELVWNKCVEGGDGEELGKNEPFAEGETYEISLTVFTDCEWGFPTDLKAEDVTINGEAVNDIYKSYDENRGYLTMNLKFAPKSHVHSFTEKKKEESHFVTGSGADCLSQYKYYYECALCDEISTEDTWASSEYGPHDLDANSYCRKCNATIYGINVGGRDVTDKNAADVFGDGKVSYDKSTNTLTLNGYTYEGDGVSFAEDEHAAILSNKRVNIQLLGENSIKTTEGMNVGGIVVLEGDCTISGTGTLSVLADGGGIALAGGNITVKSGKLVLGTESRSVEAGIMGLGVTIEDGDIDITAGSCGIYAMASAMGIAVKGGNVSIATDMQGGAYMVMDYGSGAPVPCEPNLTEYENCKVTASENADGSDAVEYNPEDIESYKYVNISHVHKFADTWQKDASNHWKECKCGEKSNVAAHTFNAGVVTKAATETATGIKTYTCSVCGATKTEDIPVVSKKPDEQTQEQAPVQETTPAPLGETITDASGIKYKVTKSDAKDPTVTYKKQNTKMSGTVIIPDTVTIDDITYKITAIEANAFKNNKKITKVTIGKNITSVGKNAFMGCTKLKTVKLGAAVTTISDKAFYKCTALTAITIPSKVSKIGKSAFYGCKKLKNITMKTTKLTSKSVGSKAFKGTPKNAKVKVPKKSLKAYKKFLVKKGIAKKAKIK